MKYLIIVLFFWVSFFTACNSTNDSGTAEVEQTVTDTTVKEEIKTPIEQEGNTDRITTDVEVTMPDDDRKEIVGLMAIGSEPGWGANFGPVKMTLVLDYGDINYSNLDYKVKKEAADTWVINATTEETELIIVIKSGGCDNDAGGEGFTHNATVVKRNNGEEKTYTGCGRMLNAVMK